MFKYIFSLFILSMTINSCESQSDQQSDISKMESESLNAEKSSKMDAYYSEWKDNNLKSEAKGKVSDGSLINGKLMPYTGNNFDYFDEESYVGGRAFTSQKVKETILDCYKKLEILSPNRHFKLMELSNQNGGKIYPHRTHQNGLSVDFMIPMLLNDSPYYGLDSLGKSHYLLSFNDNGEYSDNQEIKVDFDLIALHILELNKSAKINGMRINKVIIKIEYKDELFATPNGKLLKASGIYIVKGLTPLINYLHDDHYHIDFEKN